MSRDPVKAGKGNILIVDDTPANLRLLSEMLSEHGYHVRPVPEGSLALAAVRAEPPDLILLDIRMPEMNGYEVCGHLKANPLTCDIPVIFISALDATSDKVRAFAAGGVDYVTKPFQVEEVLARVETHLSLRALQRELEETNQRMAQELALAGKVQSSFLPQELPDTPGWQISVALRPARETSGDFYDVYALPDGKVGVLVADVVDKGAGAALYMALSWTLLRTHTVAHPTHPRQVLDAVNRRLSRDTNSSQFVTVFYGVLDLVSAELRYCNAGHCPPYLVHATGDTAPQMLTRTGMPLGIFGTESWEQRAVQIAPGDVLVLYTDGIPDAQNERQRHYGQDRLLACATAHLGDSAETVRDAILADVCRFTEEVAQTDDIALVVLARTGLANGEPM
jgi:sigma-B regulation protein RsbU (phosphoserine phosphatase)